MHNELPEQLKYPDWTIIGAVMQFNQKINQTNLWTKSKY